MLAVKTKSNKNRRNLTLSASLFCLFTTIMMSSVHMCDSNDGAQPLTGGPIRANYRAAASCAAGDCSCAVLKRQFILFKPSPEQRLSASRRLLPL